MPSPFPGMDPYVEGSPLWTDCHANLLTAFRDALNERLPERYAARTELHVWIHEPDAEERTQIREPDVGVVELSEGAAGTAAVATPPATILLPAVRRRGTRFLQIVEETGRRVVTALELLSPSNKAAGEERESYLAKRNEYFAGGVNLVEIDLLRGGTRLPLGDPQPDVADYYVLVCRAWELPQAGLWNVSLREALPDIPVPLDKDVAPVTLPLQECFNRVYDKGRYGKQLDYDQPTTPRMREPEMTWARELLAASVG
jgi:hypothetical protein